MSELARVGVGAHADVPGLAQIHDEPGSRAREHVVAHGEWLVAGGGDRRA